MRSVRLCFVSYKEWAASTGSTARHFRPLPVFDEKRPALGRPGEKGGAPRRSSNAGRSGGAQREQQDPSTSSRRKRATVSPPVTKPSWTNRGMFASTTCSSDELAQSFAL